MCTEECSFLLLKRSKCWLIYFEAHKPLISKKDLKQCRYIALFLGRSNNYEQINLIPFHFQKIAITIKNICFDK